ncbi:MAG: AMP-binding protein [Rhodospirillaceae bacterium]|nr:AMP-binding protein [Rhodospirillaceae bacterium]
MLQRILENRDVSLPLSYTSMTMGGGVQAAAARDPGKVAIRHGARTRTYADLARRIDLIADAVIADLGLARGEHAAICAKNCIEYIEIALGVPEAGVALATIDSRFTPAEIAAICDDAEARVLFVDRHTAPLVRDAKPASVRRIIEIGPEFEDWIAAERKPVTRPPVDEWDTWTIPYTSGTTGKPKGVLIPHRSRGLVNLCASAEFGCFTPDDCFLAMTPMHHGGGISFPIASITFGGTLDILEKFDAVTVLDKLKFGGVTGIFMVPTHFHSIFDLAPDVLEKYRSPQIRTIIANAAPLPQAMKEKIVPYFGTTVLHEIYSSTESGLVCSLRPPDQLRKIRCVGVPMAHVRVKIVDDDGRECAPNQVGELLSRAPYVFSGYWRRPDETAAAFRDGWVTVGDMAKRDDEGFIYIVDRKKDMVISGGVNIYPREVEEVLFAHPAVADVAVVGVPDEKWGERLKAFVVVRAGHTLSAADLVEFCRDRLASYKIPKDVAQIAELPRNTNGKVLKRTLRTM